MENLGQTIIGVIVFILTYLGFNYVQKVQAEIQATKDQEKIKKIIDKYPNSNPADTRNSSNKLAS